MKRQFTLLLIFSFIIGLNFAFAQAGNNTIEGVVHTSDGKNAQDVKVTIGGTDIEKTTNARGRFIIEGLADGKYDLIAAAPGAVSVTKTIEISGGNKIVTEIKIGISLSQLDEVIVSTTRSAKNRPSSTLRLNEPLLQVPQNITIIDNSLMSAQQITSTSDGLIRDIPGAIKLEHWGDQYARINMRGGRAAAFRNGMNFTSNWGPLTEDMSFVERVEVVKGPAGFMMSNGSPSGIYNVVTKKPTGMTRASANVMMGSYDMYRASADFEGKLDTAGKVLYRFNIMGQTKNSLRAYEYNDRVSIAPVLTYKIDDKNEASLEYIYQYAKISNIGSYYIFTTKGYGVYDKSFTETNPGFEPTIIKEHNLTFNYVHHFDDNWKLTTQVSYLNNKQQGTSMWLDSITTDDKIRRTVASSDNSNVMKFGQMYLNGEVKTGKVNHRIIAGIDLGDKEYYGDWHQTKKIDANNSLFDPNDPNYGTPSNGYLVVDRSANIRERAGLSATITQRYSGLYLQDELGFFDNILRLTLAGRYTTDKEVSYGTAINGNKFTPRIGLSGSLDKWTSVYALFDQTYVPQSGIRKDGKSVKPVTGNNMEVGIKKDWAEGKWGSTLSIYRILQNNQTSADPTNIPTGPSYIVQFGQTKTQGIEFDIHGEVLPGFNVMANYALTDSKISKADTSALKQATVGNKVPGFAKHVINLWGSYMFQQGFLQGFGVNLGYNFQGKRTTWSWAEAAGMKSLPDYIRFDGGLFYKKDNIRITCNVMNIMNRYLYSGSNTSITYPDKSVMKYYYYQAEPGRNFRLSLDVNF